MQVSIDPIHGKKVEHTGVKIELLGQIGMVNMIKASCSSSFFWVGDLRFFLSVLALLELKRSF